LLPLLVAGSDDAINRRFDELGALLDLVS